MMMTTATDSGPKSTCVKIAPGLLGNVEKLFSDADEALAGSGQDTRFKPGMQHKREEMVTLAVHIILDTLGDEIDSFRTSLTLTRGAINVYQLKQRSVFETLNPTEGSIALYRISRDGTVRLCHHKSDN